jgi:methionyl-tRNA formyltransferase
MKLIETARATLREKYPEFERGDVPRKPQDESEATWWPKRVPEHGIIDWNRSAEEVYNWIRGQTHPYPGAFSYIDGKKVTIWEAKPPERDRCFAEPGEIMETNDDKLRVAVWEESIELTRIQVEDYEEEPAASLISKHDFETGDVFRNLRDLVTPP